MLRADAAGRAGLDRRGLPRPLRAPSACTARSPALTLARFAERDRARDRHHRLGRPVLQQVPGQDRLRSRQAARLLGHRPGGGRRPSWPTSPSASFPGVGKVDAQERLARDGLRHDRRSASAPDDSELVRRYGEDGARLAAARPRRSTSAACSPGARDQERLGRDDVRRRSRRSRPTLEPILWRLCEKVGAAPARRRSYAGRSVTLKLKTADFQLRTRARSACRRRSSRARIFEAGARAAAARGCDGTRFRLIGIGASDLCAGAEADDRATSPTPTLRATEGRPEGALDRLRDRFGGEAVLRGPAPATRPRRGGRDA